MRQIYLCRHGKTAWNAERRIQGLNDIELNHKGLEQADFLAKFLKSQINAPIRIISSPLLRAKQTAAVIGEALDVPVETDERIIEINTGIFTGKCLDELATDEAWQAHLRDPWGEGYGVGGESAESVRTRVMSLIHEAIVSKDERDLLLVTHASPIRHAIMAMLDIPPRHLYHIVVHNASVSLFEDREGFYKSVYINLNPAMFFEKVV